MCKNPFVYWLIINVNCLANVGVFVPLKGFLTVSACLIKHVEWKTNPINWSIVHSIIQMKRSTPIFFSPFSFWAFSSRNDCDVYEFIMLNCVWITNFANVIIIILSWGKGLVPSEYNSDPVGKWIPSWNKKPRRAFQFNLTFLFYCFDFAVFEVQKCHSFLANIKFVCFLFILRFHVVIFIFQLFIKIILLNIVYAFCFQIDFSWLIIIETIR